MATDKHPQPIKIAILAMGGEGGGVLADWIVDLGEQAGHWAQTTSVPGVAQRTGATIYYVELFPKSAALGGGPEPVLALMPLPGDVDIVLASELMEAGRAVQRGLVTTDRTTLIASTHRVYSITEKSAMGDGRVDANQLLAHAQAAAQRLVCFDMAALAEREGSVISAVLFGALAGVGVLPFSRAQFEATIERAGLGVKSSLKAFAQGFALAQNPALITPPAPEAQAATKPVPQEPVLRACVDQVWDMLAEPARTLAIEGVRRMADYQDPAYARLYVDRLESVHQALPQDPMEVMAALARHLALWMSYEDTVRVADLKTRGSRFDRVRQEVGAQPAQLLRINEYMHPRYQEVCESLPASLGTWLMASPRLRALGERFLSRGRVVQTNSLSGFMLLYVVSAFKPWRRRTLRYQLENQRIELWLSLVRQWVPAHPALALELVLCQRLVKGYSDTHARGHHHHDQLLALVAEHGARLSAEQLRALREAALADDQGNAFRSTLASQGWA
jgi:indolepyruvate ferredoxin oxidoreductase beta subunit